MTPSEARDALMLAVACAKARAGLTAAETARILAAADEYAAASINACARSPRSQSGERRAS